MLVAICRVVKTVHGVSCLCFGNNVHIEEEEEEGSMTSGSAGAERKEIDLGNSLGRSFATFLHQGRPSPLVLMLSCCLLPVICWVVPTFVGVKTWVVRVGSRIFTILFFLY